MYVCAILLQSAGGLLAPMHKRNFLKKQQHVFAFAIRTLTLWNSALKAAKIFQHMQNQLETVPMKW